MTHSLVVALLVCALSAAAEGAFAGSGIKDRLTRLRLPRYSLPLWGWFVVGMLYYVVCFVVLLRLLGSSSPSNLRIRALVLVVLLMAVNAFWNYLFFRVKSLFWSFIAFLPYNGLAIAIFLSLLPLDRIAAWTFFPYIVYLTYANWWAYDLWRLNPDR